ncbi:hypothetical protein QXB72_002456 [Vibrio fluvialis]|nr:hypothetical protein [Vibrio fluvialis]
MRTLIGISNFSFDNQNFFSFNCLVEQFEKIKNLQGKFPQHNVSLALANDILRNDYFGNSIEQQFTNFSFGNDRQAIIAFKARLDRNYFSGFNKSYTSEELKELSLTPDEVNRICCTLFAPKVLTANYSSFKRLDDFSDYYEYILGNHPIDESSYYERAISHFTNLVYHADCESTLSRVTDGFCNYSIAITKCLKALNDSSPISNSSTQGKLSEIRAKVTYNLTAEGYSHPNFKYAFSYSGTNYASLDCQYHLKPSDRNQKGNSSFNHKRVYFGFIPLSTNSWKIAVAAIGPHISTHDQNDRYALPKKKRKK